MQSNPVKQVKIGGKPADPLTIEEEIRRLERWQGKYPLGAKVKVLYAKNPNTYGYIRDCYVDSGDIWYSVEVDNYNHIQVMEEGIST